MKSKCPICKKETSAKFRPFCSQRCKDIDLGHWLKGDYLIPGENGDAEHKKNEDKDDEDD